MHVHPTVTAVLFGLIAALCIERPFALASDTRSGAALASQFLQVPDPDQLANDSFGRTVRYGRDLIAHTSALIGPDARKRAMRYTGNGMECQNCHLAAGTKPFAVELAGVWGMFPAFIAREGEVRTLEERINGCMERSMNGRALPADGPEMKALLTYLRFVSAGEIVGKSVLGRGTPALPLMERAADPARGARVYEQTCAVCHQANGQGQRLDAAAAVAKQRRYLFPPLWGPDSYSDGAGMARPVTAARFIRANMPFGTAFDHPVLSVEDAFDVAVFIDSRSRPHFAGSEYDYPDLALKPADATYPPFAGPFPAEQHRFGPWKPIQNWLDANGAMTPAEPAVDAIRPGSDSAAPPGEDHVGRSEHSPEASPH